MSNQHIIDRMNTLIKGVAAAKTAAVKTASPGGDLKTDNGTAAPQTGARMAENKADSGKGTKAAIDGGAVVNPTNGSVTNSTDGASAAAVNGQSGATGGVLAVKGEAPNEKGGSIKSASLSEQLRKAAADLSTPVAKTASSSENATFLKGLLKSASAPRTLSSLEKHIASLVKTGSIKVAGDASGMDDGSAADAGVQDLVQKLESGQISEEQAEQMIMQALDSGALSKDDVVKAMHEMHAPGAAGDPAAQPAPGGDAGTPPAAADPSASSSDADAGSDPAMAQKVAMASIGEDHPEYISKLKIVYPDVMALGKQACAEFAEALIKQASETPGGSLEPSADAGTKKVEEAPGAVKPKPADGATKAQVDNNQAKDLPAAKTAADGSAMPVAPPADPSAGAPPVDPMAGAGIAPQGPDEKATLDAILKQMGITPDQAIALLSTDAGAPADPTMGKTAAYALKVASVFGAKLGQLDITTAAK